MLLLEVLKLFFEKSRYEFTIKRKAEFGLSNYLNASNDLEFSKLLSTKNWLTFMGQEI